MQTSCPRSYPRIACPSSFSKRGTAVTDLPRLRIREPQSPDNSRRANFDQPIQIREFFFLATLLDFRFHLHIHGVRRD